LLPPAPSPTNGNPGNNPFVPLSLIEQSLWGSSTQFAAEQ